MAPKGRGEKMEISWLLKSQCLGGIHHRGAVGGNERRARPVRAVARWSALRKGEVVLLNVWATWCKPCREEIPALDSLHREFAARGLRVIGVSIDVAGDTAEIAGFARELGASYALWLDPDDKVSTTFRAIGVPSTALIDRDGVLRWRHMGPVRASDAALRALLDSTLGG